MHQKSFGVALKEAIKREFGTQKEFAKKYGVSAGRVSQLISGDERPGPETLASVLECFSDLASQELIYAGWLNQYAPLPVQSILTLDTQEIFDKIHALGVEGSPVRALQHAEAWSEETTDLRIRQELLRHVVEISLRLTKVSRAARSVLDMERKAREDGGTTDIFTSLWLRSLVLNAMDGVGQGAVLAAHDAVMQYAGSASAPASADRERWLKQRAMLYRDHAHHIATLVETKGADKALLDHALLAVQKSIEEGTDRMFLPYGLEMRSRIEVLKGEFTKAEETLSELEGIGDTGGWELWEKTKITTAKIKAGRGDVEEAIHILEQVSEDCFNRMNLHHHRRADQLLAKLILGLDVKEKPLG